MIIFPALNESNPIRIGTSKLFLASVLVHGIVASCTRYRMARNRSATKCHWANIVPKPQQQENGVFLLKQDMMCAWGAWGCGRTLVTPFAHGRNPESPPIICSIVIPWGFCTKEAWNNVIQRHLFESFSCPITRQERISSILFWYLQVGNCQRHTLPAARLKWCHEQVQDSVFELSASAGDSD